MKFHDRNCLLNIFSKTDFSDSLLQTGDEWSIDTYTILEITWGYFLYKLKVNAVIYACELIIAYPLESIIKERQYFKSFKLCCICFVERKRNSKLRNVCF